MSVCMHDSQTRAYSSTTITRTCDDCHAEGELPRCSGFTVTGDQCECPASNLRTMTCATHHPDRHVSKVDHDALTNVYRCFDVDGVLLYVGISVNVIARIGEHRKSKLWWPAVETMTIEHHSTRKRAAIAERDAIQAEHPLHNDKFNGALK